MNCPKCRSGVLEKAGYINLAPRLQEELYDFQLDVTNEEMPFRLILYICSLETCNHTSIQASVNFLSLLKEERKKQYKITPPVYEEFRAF